MAPNTTGSQLIRELAANIKDKIVLITGTSPGGIGALYAQKIAEAAPGMLILTGRNRDSIQPTVEAVQAAAAAKAGTTPLVVKTLAVDFGSLESVRTAAAEAGGWADVPRIDVLVSNAGIMGVPWGKTAEGFEMQFGVNHLGPFLFMNLLMDKVLASPSPRVVVVSSDGHRVSPIRWADINFKDGRCYDKWRAYGQSKTANNLTAVALAKRLGGKGLQAYSVHPGVYMSNLTRGIPDFHSEGVESLRATDEAMGNRHGRDDAEFEFLDEEQIIATHIWASFTDELQDHNGAHLRDCHIADQYKEEVWPWSIDVIESDKLWSLSEKLVGQEFKY